MRILLLLVLLLPSGALQEASILALDSEEPDVSDPRADGGLLLRELVRQAILVAGRDGLGLRTRDKVLGETFPDGVLPLKVRTLAIPGKSVAVKITRNDAVLWEKSIPLPAGDTVDYEILAREAELLSRTGFVDALKAAGFQGKATVKAERGKVSDTTEKALMVLTVTEQFRALRELHAAARESGDAPVRLQAIVRGYSHLASITENILAPLAKAYKGRALIYAERACALWPGTRYVHWTRAYARALVGLHGSALEDLAVAAKLPAENDPMHGVVPHWAPWIEAYCRNDDRAFAAAEAPFNRGLLKFLAYLMYSGCRNMFMESRKLREALQANPECYDLYEAQCAMGGLANLNQATVTGPTMLASRIYGRVADLPGIPETVRRICEDHEQDVPEPQLRPRLWKALAAASDVGEPSWGALGRWIQEATFRQVVRRADLMRFKWAAQRETVVKFMNESRVLVEDHPYLPYFESFALDKVRQRTEWNALLSKLTLVDAEMHSADLFTATEGVSAPGKIFGRKAEELAWRHGDAISVDLETAVLFQFFRDWNNMPARKTKALALAAVCPHSPTAAAELIASDWDRVSPKAAEWEELYALHPQVLHEFGWKYKHLKRLADSERCFGKIFKLAPVLRDTMDLATLYKEQGNLQRWKEVLDGFLQVEDVAGLAHDSVRKELAKHFMAKKEWKTALPYAEAAGQSWTAWGMECARDCNEGLADLEKAHEWQKRISERYPKTETHWYFWVKKHGYGDEAEAEACAVKWMESLPGATASDCAAKGTIQTLRGRPQEALAAYDEALKLSTHPYYALYTALAAMEMKDAATRDRAIAAGRDHTPKDKDTPVYGKELLASFAEILAAAPGTKPDLKAWEAMLAKQEGVAKINLPYFMGRFLELRGQKDEAKTFYQRCSDVEMSQARNLTVVLAADALRRLGK